MIKNVKLKSILSNTVFKGISRINKIVPKQDSIVLLYSNMGFRDNVAYVYDYMIENGYNRKYRIIRSQNEKYTGDIPQNVVVVRNFKAILYYLIAGHVFYAFGKLPIYPSKGQRVVQMWHGSPFKGGDNAQKNEKSRNYQTSYYTNFFATAECFAGIYAEEFDCGINRISICGQPRTDVMINPYSDDELKLNGNQLIVWVPTFRKSKALGYNDVENKVGILPIIKTEQLQALNDILNQYNITMLVKLHPVEDLDSYTKMEFSNLCILSHKEFVKREFDLYRLLGSTNALITDYSSVFYDFMLLNRPIAFTIDDYDDYKDHRGFAVNNPDYYRTGSKLNSFDDVVHFIISVADGQDEWRERRSNVNEEVNTYRDFQNRKRALEIGGVYL